MSHGSILVVDDEEDVLLAARLALKRHFACVETLRDPAGLPDRVKAGSFDVLVLDAESAAGRDTEWFHTVESEHDRVLYVGAFDDARWSQRCLRQCDRMLLIARAGATPPASLSAQLSAARERQTPVELVLVNATASTRPHGAAAWLDLARRELGDEVGQQRRGVGERLVERVGQRPQQLISRY